MLINRNAEKVRFWEHLS